jgi:hypothetical protein
LWSGWFFFKKKNLAADPREIPVAVSLKTRPHWHVGYSGTWEPHGRDAKLRPRLLLTSAMYPGEPCCSRRFGTTKGQTSCEDDERDAWMICSSGGVLLMAAALFACEQQRSNGMSCMLAARHMLTSHGGGRILAGFEIDPQGSRKN